MSGTVKAIVTFLSVWAWTSVAVAAGVKVDTLPEGPRGGIEDLTEQEFFVDGSIESARVFTFSNGSRFVYFIPMIHQAEPAFYDAIAGGVKQLKANGMDLFYEFIDFDDATLDVKRKVRAMVGFLPSPSAYAETVPDGLVGQDNAMFLGFSGGQDFNIDVTPAQLTDAYERLVGPLEISDENLSTPIDEFVTPTADITQVIDVTINWRNKILANAINDATRDLIVLYGAAHGAGTIRDLYDLDPRWQRVE